MKKLLIILAAVGVMSFATSCKRCYTCTVGGVTGTEVCDDVYNQTQIDALKLTCELNSGTWAAK